MSSEKSQIKKLTDKMISDIMNEFDFARVHSAMCSLDWKWHNDGSKEGYIPSLYQTMEMAKFVLTNVMNNYGDGMFHLSSCGGFQASLNEDGCLCLQFILSELTTEAPFYDEYVPHSKLNKDCENGNVRQTKASNVKDASLS